MSLFRKNPNEVAYNGGQKHIVDRIDNTALADALVWKQPEEDFNTNSTVTVYHGWKAIFFNNADYIGTLDEGSHQLQTDNIPFLSRFRNMLSGGISQFPCKIYYIRTGISREINWGSSMLVTDPIYSVGLTLQGYGGYKIRIVDEMIFLGKVMTVLDSKPAFYPQDMDDWFKSQFMEEIESAIGNYFQDSQDEVIRNCSRRREISKQVSEYMQTVLDEYGLELVNFAIESLKVPSDDPGFIELNAKRAQAAGEMHQYQHQGAAYQAIQGMKILQDIANNPGAGGIASAGAGLGMGMAAGSVVGDIARSVFTQPQQPVQQPQQPAGGNNRFGVGGNNGAGNPAQQDDPTEKLAKLKKMLDMGLIEQSEYDEAKKEVMAKLLG